MISEFHGNENALILVNCHTDFNNLLETVDGRSRPDPPFLISRTMVVNALEKFAGVISKMMLAKSYSSSITGGNVSPKF